VRFTSHRRSAEPAWTSRFDYEPHDGARTAEPGTLEFFLVERYILFAERGGRLYSGQVHHTPYPVRDATVREWDDHMLALRGLPRPGRAPDHAILSRGVEVDVFPLKPL
jgi:uncharacterized protein YqjF (DUF2071 family)